MIWQQNFLPLFKFFKRWAAQRNRMEFLWRRRVLLNAGIRGEGVCLVYMCIVHLQFQSRQYIQTQLCAILK